MDVLVLLLLLAFVSVLAVTAVHTIWTGIPLIPTSKKMAETMMQLHTWKGDEVVIDLGAGDGRLLEYIKKQHPAIHARGCEIVPAVWFIGFMRALVTRSGVHLRLGSMFLENISDADVLLLYLFPEHMQTLVEKCEKELKPGAVVITHTFPFHGKVPEKTMWQKHLGGEVNVFLYRF